MKKITFILVILLSIQAGAQCWHSVSAGYVHSAAVRTDGTLWTWGLNTSGELGLGYNSTSEDIPMRVGTEQNWATVSAGSEDHTVGIKIDGTMWAWGGNNAGQLGTGNTVSTNVPVQVGTDTNWRAVSCGESFTVALKWDNTLWAFGSDFYGQLGNGAADNQNTPTQIGTDNNWQSVSSGIHHVVATKLDGSLWVWGSNGFGQLGDGTYLEAQLPVQIGIGSFWVNATAGERFSSAIRLDRTLWTWGNNTQGQLGDGTYVSKNFPVQVMAAGNDWSAVEAGDGHAVAIKWDGSLWTWGNNLRGQLGDGTHDNRNTPGQVDTGGVYGMITAGGFHTMAIQTNNSLLGAGMNIYGQVGIDSVSDITTLAGVSCPALGVNSQTPQTFRVFPNPVDVQLHIFSNDGHPIETIVLRDISGKMVLSKAGNLNSVDMANLEAGIYFLQIVSGSKSEIFRIVKQ